MPAMSTRRIINSNGTFLLQRTRFRAPSLANYPERSILVRFDPEDLSAVIVRDAEGNEHLAEPEDLVRDEDALSGEHYIQFPAVEDLPANSYVILREQMGVQPSAEGDFPVGIALNNAKAGGKVTVKTHVGGEDGVARVKWDWMAAKHVTRGQSVCLGVLVVAGRCEPGDVVLGRATTQASRYEMADILVDPTEMDGYELAFGKPVAQPTEPGNAQSPAVTPEQGGETV